MWRSRRSGGRCGGRRRRAVARQHPPPRRNVSAQAGQAVRPYRASQTTWCGHRTGAPSPGVARTPARRPACRSLATSASRSVSPRVPLPAPPSAGPPARGCRRACRSAWKIPRPGVELYRSPSAVGHGSAVTSKRSGSQPRRAEASSEAVPAGTQEESDRQVLGAAGCRSEVELDPHTEYPPPPIRHAGRARAVRGRRTELHVSSPGPPVWDKVRLQRPRARTISSDIPRSSSVSSIGSESPERDSM